MQRSSKKNPCPACGRVHDADCAWSDDVIFCHSGSDLSIGQTIDVDGQPWALVKLNAGFSGNAAVFKPHEENRRYPDKSGASPEQILTRQAKRSISALALERFFNAFDAAWNVKDFHSLSPNELKEGINAITKAHHNSIEMKATAQTIWREHKDLSDLYRDRFEACVLNLKYQVNDLTHFRTHYLGEAVK